MRMLKKVTAVLLAVSMVLSVGIYGNTAQAEEPEVVQAEAQEVAQAEVQAVAQSIEYTPLVLDQTVNVTLDENNTIEYFSFTPTEDMICMFESEGATRALEARLYEVINGKEVYLTRSSSANNSFYLCYQLKANTEYHFTVEKHPFGPGGSTTNWMNFEVILKKSPVVKVEAESVEVVEGFEGYQSNGYYDYWLGSKVNGTVTMEDGQTYEINYGSLYYNNKSVSIDAQTNQTAENPWKAGHTYTATMTILGYTAEFSVTVKESPVESIEVEPIILSEYGSGYFMNQGTPNEWFCYQWEDFVQYTITMKNGEVIQGKGNRVQYDMGSYQLVSGDNQWSSHWYAGNTYELKASFGGKSTTCSISVYEKNMCDGFEYILQENEAVIMGCNKTDAVLEIPEGLDGHTVTGIANLTWAMEYAEELIIPDTVTMLSKGIFEWNYQLKKLTLGEGISNLKNEYFTGAECLEEITVAEGNATYKSVDGVVYDKEVTEIVVFPRAKAGTYTVPDTVTDIFVLMDNIKLYNVQIDLGNSNTDYCIENGVIYNRDKTIVYGCDKEVEGKYVMPNTVTTIKKGAFAECGFSEVVVSENVSEIVYSAFEKSLKLEKVVLPDKLETIGWGAFYQCENLEEAVIPANVKTINSYAYNESGIKSISLSEGIKTIGCCAFENSQLEEVILPNSLTKLSEFAFNNTPLEKLTIGTGLESISDSAFKETALKTVTFPENISIINQFAFKNSELEEVVFLNDRVYIDDGAFSKCPIKKVNLENCEYIGMYAFEGSHLTEIEIPESITGIAYKSFIDSEKLAYIQVPENLEYINGYAFKNTAWWNNKPDGVVYLGNYCYGYHGDMPEGFEISVKEGTTLIADLGFANQLNLKSVIIPASVTSCGWAPFEGCFNLENVTVAEGNSNLYTNKDGTILYDKEIGNPIWKKVVEVNGISPWGYYEHQVPYGQSIDKWVASFESYADVQYVDGGYGSESFAVTPDMITGYDSTVPGEHTATLKFGEFTKEISYFVEDEPEEILTGWNQLSGTWYYFDENGKVVKNAWVGAYYVDENGAMVTNAWVDGDKYYVGADGTYVNTTGWFNLDGDYYYLESGLKQTGWKKVGPAYYYFDETTGVMLADEWLNDTYYLNASGAMATGWQLLDGNYYYFDANGAKVTNQWVGDYYLKADGVMAKDEVVEGIKVGADGKKVTGWHFTDTKWYYYQDGKLATGWTLVGPTWYYMDPETGVMLANAWLNDTYYMTAGGAMATGWLLLGEDYYYFNVGGAKVTNSWVGSYFMDENGVMATNAWVDNGRYYVDASGAYVSASGWFLLDEGYYYLAGGCKQTGWVSLGPAWYYMNPETGVMLANEWLNDTYYMTESGAMATGWLWLDGAYYYMSAGGAKVTNQWMGNYYLQEDGTMATNTWIGNYYVGENGAWDSTKTK